MRNPALVVVFPIRWPNICAASAAATNRRCRSFRYQLRDRKSTRLNSSHVSISYAVFCLKKKNVERIDTVTLALILIIVCLLFRPLYLPLLPLSAIGLSVGLAFGLVYVICLLALAGVFLV